MRKSVPEGCEELSPGRARVGERSLFLPTQPMSSAVHTKSYYNCATGIVESKDQNMSVQMVLFIELFR
jgi:hypothetical protein